MKQKFNLCVQDRYNVEVLANLYRLEDDPREIEYEITDIFILDSDTDNQIDLTDDLFILINDEVQDQMRLQINQLI